VAKIVCNSGSGYTKVSGTIDPQGGRTPSGELLVLPAEKTPMRSCIRLRMHSGYEKAIFRQLRYFSFVLLSGCWLAIADGRKHSSLEWKLAVQSKEAGHVAGSPGRPASELLPKRDFAFLRSIDLGTHYSDRIPVHYSKKFLAVIYHHEMYWDRTIEHC